MKILIVDDSETLRTQLRRDLESGKFTVVEGRDGVNGLEVLEANPDVRLIICDVNMPIMDGLTMCARLRTMESFKALPVLMLTTESTPELKARGKSTGVIAWVTKPYVAEKLLKAVTQITKSGS